MVVFDQSISLLGINELSCLPWEVRFATRLKHTFMRLQNPGHYAHEADMFL